MSANAEGRPRRLDADAAVLALLEAAELPVDDLRDAPPTGPTLYGWCDARGEPIGVVGLQPLSGRAFLLRSLAVRAERRGGGLGARLVAHAEAVAAAAGGDTLHLLTDSAEAFFRNRGYHVSERDSAPPALRSTALFRGLCPASAVYMSAPCGHDGDRRTTEDAARS